MSSSKRWRIVTDRYCGYEVQWRWKWLPIWWQANGCNTHFTVEGAEIYARRCAKLVVKELGPIPSTERTEPEKAGG